MSNRPFLYVFALLGFFFVRSASAADGVWTNSNGGTWGTAANWSGSVIGNGAGFRASFTNDITTTRTITLDANRTIGQLIFADNNSSGSAWVLSPNTAGLVLTLSNNGTTPVITASTNATIGVILGGTAGVTITAPGTLNFTADNTYSGGTTVASGSLYVGNGGTSGGLGSGTLSILSGGGVYFARSDTYTFGNTIVGSGYLYQAGSGTTILTGSNNSLGAFNISAGTLKFSGGANAVNTGGSVIYGGGTLVVSGSTSQLRYSSFNTQWIGNFGNGTLRVEDGGRNIAYTIQVGYGSAATGTLFVTGAGSRATATNALLVGGQATGIAGNLQIDSGGQVDAGYVSLGFDTNASATVSGSSSRLTSTTYLDVGYNTPGNLTIADGAVVSATTLQLMNFNSAVTLTGAGSQLNITKIAYLYNGSLFDKNGAQVATGTAYLTSGSTTASISGLGSSWTVTNGLYVGGTETTSGGVARLSVTGGGALVVGTTLKLWNNGTLTIDGGSVTARNFDRSLGTLVFNDGTLTVSGGVYTQTTGSGTASNILTLNGNTPTAAPLFQMTNGASAVGVEAMVIGSTGRGELLISGGSTLTNTGGGVPLGFVAGTAIARGQGYLGLAAGSTGTATVTGGNSRWIIKDSLYVGLTGTGTLNVLNGGTVTAGSAYFGANANSEGNLTLDGFGSSLIVSSTLSFGPSGNSHSSVANGAQIRSNNTDLGYLGGSGEVVISGNGSRWDNTSDIRLGMGQISVMNGGNLTVSGSFFIATNNSSAIGSVVVDGTNSTLNVKRSVYVGMAGEGSLILQNGGTASALSVTVGPNSNLNGQAAYINVGGSGSKLTVTASLTVGGASNNSYLYIHDGGTVTAGSAYFGANVNSEGDLTLDGTGSLLNVSGTLVFGQNGYSENQVLNGAQIRSGNAFLGVGAASNGIVSLMNGANWTVTNNLTIGNASGATGYLELQAGTSASVGGTLSVDPNNGYLYVYENSVLTLGAVSGSLGNNFGNLGTIQLSSNSSLTSFGTIGTEVGGAGNIEKIGSGTYNVAGAIVNADYLTVSSGTLQVVAGGSITTANANVAQGVTFIVDNGSFSGALGVSGTGIIRSTQASVTNAVLSAASTGVLRIEGGARVNANASNLIAGPDGSPSLIVTGSNTSLELGNPIYDNDTLLVEGWTTKTAMLNVMNGATLTAYGRSVIHNSGTAIVQSGGHLTTQAANLSGSAIVSGTGSSWTINDYLLVSGTQANATITGGGSLHLLGNADVQVGATVQIGNGGNVQVDGVMYAYSGTVRIGNGGHFTGDLRGKVVVDSGGFYTGNITTTSQNTVGGAGVIGGSVSGGGTISPGNSPGILDVAQVDPSSGLSFLFEFTRANTMPDFLSRTAPGNDVLHLTGANPFLAALTPSNTIDINILLDSMSTGDIFYGGFFTNFSGTDFVADGTISNAQYHLLFHGVELSSEWGVEISSIPMTGVDFGTDYGGTVDGRLMQITITGPPHASVPEPGSMVLAGMAAAGFYARRRKQLKQAREAANAKTPE